MAPPLPSELLSDLQAKFTRYSVEEDDVRKINLSGFKYLLKSCPKGSHLNDISEERLEALFLEAAGPSSTKRGR
jgi:hypothetical protein